MVNLEMQGREEFQKKKIKFRDVEFATEEMKKAALGSSETAVYYGMLDVFQLYLSRIQKAMK